MRRGLWLVLGILLVAGPVTAQEQRGSIEGIVKDSSGAVLPGVTVEARNPAGGAVATSITDATGAYRFPALPPGEYEVTADLQGFTPRHVRVPLGLGQLKKIDITLNIAGVAESVQVTAESPIVDVKQSASFQNIRNELVDKLPRGRDFTSLVTIAPGANSESKLAGISIDGASGAENQYVVDGITTTNIQNGRSGKGVVTDFVSEVQVKSSGYAAEFGGATGGVINVITKSGTNRFRGDAGFYFTSDGLEGSQRPSLRLNPSTEVAEYITYDTDKFTRWEPAFTVGGPMLRDRLWFFVGYVPTLDSTDRTTGLDDGTRATYNQDRKTHNFTGNLDTQISSKLRARFAVNLNNYKRTGTLPNRTYGNEEGTSSALYPWASTGQKLPNATYSGQLDFVASNKFYVGVRGGYFRTDINDFGIPDEIRYIFGRSNVGFMDVPASLQHPRGWSNLSTNFASTYDVKSRIGFDVSATYYANLAGQHAFKGGVQFDRYGNDVLRGEQQPRPYIYWGLTRRTNDGRAVKGTYGYYHVRQFQTTGNIHSNNIGLYIQDAWTVNNRLTINAGVRTETEHVPSYDPISSGRDNAITFGFGDKLAPRVGFAYDVKGDGKWRAYGSYGRFFDITKLEMPRGSFGGDKWIQNYYTLDTYDWPSFAVNGNYPGTLIETINYRYNSAASDALQHGGGVDPALKPVEQWEFTLGLDHELSPTMSVGVRYVHKDLVRTIEDVGIIVPGVGEVYTISNPGFGLTKTTLPTECNGPCPDQPPARRDYDGVELRMTRRFSQNWSLNASYLYSRLYGNYSGLANSDENGRSSPNVNRVFDGLYNSFDQTGRPVFGRLATDRPHQLKVQGIYDFPWGTTISANYYIATGTPLQTQGSNLGIPFYPNGRGDLGRTPTFSQTDLYLQHEFRLGNDQRIQVQLNVNNLFDQKTPVSRDLTPYQQGLNLDDAVFFAGFDFEQLAQQYKLEPDPSHNFDGGYGPGVTAFQGKRQLRFGVKYIF